MLNHIEWHQNVVKAGLLAASLVSRLHLIALILAQVIVQLSNSLQIFLEVPQLLLVKCLLLYHCVLLNYSVSQSVSKRINLTLTIII